MDGLLTLLPIARSEEKAEAIMIVLLQSAQTDFRRPPKRRRSWLMSILSAMSPIAVRLKACSELHNAYFFTTIGKSPAASSLNGNDPVSFQKSTVRASARSCHIQYATQSPLAGCDQAWHE